MRYQLKIPARINILGNPTDGNEGDFATISAAVNIFAGAIVEEAEGVVLEVIPRTQALDSALSCVMEGEEHLETLRGEHPLRYDGQSDLLKGAVNRLFSYSAEFREKYARKGVHIAVWSDVPRQSGLGGSSLFVLLALAGLREFYGLDPAGHNDYVLAELAQRVEARELGITCGYADRYVPLFGGIAYLDYRGKLHQTDIDGEPYVTYEYLDNWVQELPFVAVTTGIQHDSGDVHGRMRPRYVQEYDAWLLEKGEPPLLVRLMQQAYETAWQGKAALLRGDLECFGHLMNNNHRLVDEMMSQCGFCDGAGWANNLFVQVALENGALGAKLTGAGGGGSVFALVRPGEEARLAEIWERTAGQNGLCQACIYRPHIVHHGILIEAID